MMKLGKLLIAALLVLVPAYVAAQSTYPAPGGQTVPGALNMCLNASNQAVACSATTPVPVTTGTATGSNNVIATGNVPGGATDQDNPVKVGCLYNTTAPTYANGQRTDCQTGTRGSINVTLMDKDSATGINTSTDNADAAVASGAPKLATVGRGTTFNGSTWDRDFTCPNTAPINITAGTTGQVIALSGSTVIRVCSFAVSLATAGTVSFLYGTGSTCGTGTTGIMSAMTLGSGVPFALSGARGSVFRGAAANAVCVSAVTGSAVGWMTYAQF